MKTPTTPAALPAHAHTVTPAQKARLAAKCRGAAALAVSEMRLGQDQAAYAAGAIAGQLAAKAGLTIAQLDTCLGTERHDRCSSSPAWDAMVDGYYDWVEGV